MAGETEQLVVALEARIRDFERNFQRASRTADSQFSSIERRAQRAARDLETSLRSSTANINRMLGAVGVGVSFNEIRRFADAWTEAGNKVRAAAASTGVQVRSLQELKRGANDARTSIEDYADLYARLTRSAAGVAKTEEEIARATNIVAKSFKAGGASAAEQASGILQLGQALGSGVLQGDELRSLRENAPVLAQAIADEFGVTIAQLKKLGEEGKLTSDRVFKAILNAQANVEAQFAATNATIGDSFTRLRNEFTAYIGGIDEAHGITAAFASGLNFLATNIGSVTEGAAAAAAILLGRYVPALARAALAQTAVVLTNPWLLLATVIGGAAVALSAFGDEIHPIQGELATLQDYAAVAWEDIKAGASEAASIAGDAFMSAVNFIADALGGAEISVADLADFAKQAANNIINGFVLLYDTLVVTFTKLPQAIAEAVLNAINGMIGLVESGLNTVVSGVNAAVNAINSVGESVGVTLGTVGEVTLGRIANGYAGAGEEAGRAYLDALRKVTRDRVGEALGSMRDRANERAADREARQAEEARKTEERKNAAIPGSDRNTSADATKANAFEKEIAGIQKRIASLRAEIEVRRNFTGTLEEQRAAIERARMVQELLNSAQEAGVEITDDVRSKIASIADAYSAAAQEARNLAKSQEEAAQKAEELEGASKDAVKGFITDLVNAKSPAEALLGALNKLSAKLLDMALDALWERIFGPSRGNNIFSTWGKGLATPAPATSATATPISTTPVTTQPAELKMTAPVGKVERAELPPVIGGDLRGSLDPFAKATESAANTFAKQITLTPQEITDLKKTLMTEWVPGQGDAQGKGIIDTILNRRASGKWGDSVTDVVNARKQFSDVNGPPAWKHGRRSVDDLSVNDPRYARASRLVDGYLPERAAGAPSMVGDHLNYANRAQSDAVNFGWIDKLDGPKLGAHRHGTTANLQRFRPGEYGINLPGQTMLAGTPAVDPMTTGAIPQAQQLAQQQEQIVQQQIEAQQRLAQQMAATSQATTQAVPGLTNMGQGVSGLIGPLASAVPGLGQFGGAIQQLLSQLLSSPMGGGAGLLGGLLGFAEGGEISGPGTGTSDSIPILASDGEFMVNAKATKKNRALLEAINSGKTPAFAMGELASRNAFSNSSTYAPSVAISMQGSSGNPKQDARFAQQVATAVDAVLQRPDGFRRTEGQKLAKLAGDLRVAGGRNS